MKGITFNAEKETVKAILAGCKTVTRQLLKPQPDGGRYVMDCDEEGHTFDIMCGKSAPGFCVDFAHVAKAPYWVGDVLYVKEATWEWPGGYEYRADQNQDEELGYIWTRPDRMPKEAARIFLRVTRVRPERLQEISLEDMQKDFCFNKYAVEAVGRDTLASIQWDSTIKKKDIPVYGWNANPWVWVIEFERISKEEADEIEKGKVIVMM